MKCILDRVIVSLVQKALLKTLRIVYFFVELVRVSNKHGVKTLQLFRLCFHLKAQKAEFQSRLFHNQNALVFHFFCDFYETTAISVRQQHYLHTY